MGMITMPIQPAIAISHRLGRVLAEWRQGNART